jgi:hypothetical protein
MNDTERHALTDTERHALSTLNFNLVPVPEDVWRPSENHVPELHKVVVDSIFDGVSMARNNPNGSPQGVVVQGPAGSGKTHMLGMVRERTQGDETGYFFLVSLFSGTEFWQTIAMAVTQGLRRPGFEQRSQLVAFLKRIAAELGMESADRRAICGDDPITPEILARFIHALRAHDPVLGREVQHTARALVLMASTDYTLQDIADTYLGSLDERDWPDWPMWRLPVATREPRMIVSDVSRLLALTGPTVIAFDQLDMLFAQALGPWTGAGSELPTDQRIMVSQIAEGLVGLREVTQRTLIVLACIPATWELLRGNAAGPFVDRFRESAAIGRILDASIAKRIVEKHLDAHWSRIGFKKDYDIWPMAKNALDDAGRYTARTLLRLVHRQARLCLSENLAPGVATLADLEGAPDESGPSVQRDDPTIDRLFDDLVRSARIDDALDPTTEDRALPPLLEAGLKAWVLEQSRAGYKVDPPPGASPPLHARLREVLDEQIEDERHWAIRGIAAKHHGAVQARIRKACLAAGLAAGVKKRRVVLLRNGSWDLGPKTVALVKQFRADGGLTMTIDADDLKTFAALRQMLEANPTGLSEWLAASRPASSTRLLREVLGDDPSRGTPELEPPPDGPPPTDPPPVTPPLNSPPLLSRQRDETTLIAESFSLGDRFDGGRLFEVPLSSLRKHAVVFAGSGSGKTVLLRRIVEECALAGVSSIVLDSNNDLARLGDAWPAAPAGWAAGDQEKAQRYLTATEVVVWTPLVNRGNPVTFQPLPNFKAVRNEADELRAAVDIAVAALAPRARMYATTAQAVRGQAVLRSALYYFARRSEHADLPSFVSLLANLPDGVTDLVTGPKLAREMAETLAAVRTNDPLFGGDGTPVDPGNLLTPSVGKQARVSVVSFIGLNSAEQQQAFVNQLQMALFSWIKRNPAGDRPLRGLFVMDEAQNFAPSTGNTPCTESTLQLASQARKYGLGLVFATQAPRGLHNRISGNASTQFFGLLNAQVQVSAARELAQAKGSNLPDISRLEAGQFYASQEGTGFDKIKTPLCLSHHPSSPLTPEEVVERAQHSLGLLGSTGR